MFTSIGKAQAHKRLHLLGYLNRLRRLSPIPNLYLALQCHNMGVERGQHLLAWQGIQKGEGRIKTSRVVRLGSAPELFEQAVKLLRTSSGNGIDRLCSVARLLGSLQGDEPFGGEFFEGIMDRPR